MEAAPLTPFPASRRPPPTPSPHLAALGVALRPAARGDLDGLRGLYAQTRALELLAAPWDARAKSAFCDSQFALQHTDYIRHFPRGDFWVVVRAGQVIGRLYLDRGRRDWRVVDITLAAEARGAGVGRALLEWVRVGARAAGSEAVVLTVRADNSRAQALYARLGFVVTGDADPFHRAMAWRIA